MLASFAPGGWQAMRIILGRGFDGNVAAERQVPQPGGLGPRGAGLDAGVVPVAELKRRSVPS